MPAPPDPLGNGPNAAIVAELTKLLKIYDGTGDHWRRYAYGRAIAMIRRLDTRIETADDVRRLAGVGEGIAVKVDEILRQGTPRKLQALEGNAEVQALQQFGRIWGVGPSTAKQLYARGFRTLEDLARAPAHALTPQQRVGLARFDDLQERMSQAEVARIEAVVRAHATQLRAALSLTVCGSYRRGMATSGDVDILLCDHTGKPHDGLLTVLIQSLEECGFLTDRLSMSVKSLMATEPDSYMGVCRVPACTDPEQCSCAHAPTPGGGAPAHRHRHRRIDIKVYPKAMYPFALLYFTGSDYFNRSMRLYCHKKGLSLSDKGLVPVVRVRRDVVHEAPSIPCESEEEIFAAIGLEYKAPAERNV